MYCGHCGRQLDDTLQFCTSCGQSTAPRDAAAASLVPPAAQPVSEAVALQTLNSHVRVLGILWAIYSGLRILMALWTVVFSRMLMPMVENFMPHDSNVNVVPFLHLLSGIYIVSGLYGIVAGAAGFWASWALLKHERSGRLIALIIGFVSLISIPFGTGLGVYTLVILLSKDAERTYERLAAAA